MIIRYEWLGTKALADALKTKSEQDYRKVERKNILQMRNRAVKSNNPSQGGTPVDTSELRKSASVSSDGTTFGYTKDYAPHVEYGHRVVVHGRTVGYVPGQYFLRSNVNIQKTIFREDLINEMRRK